MKNLALAVVFLAFLVAFPAFGANTFPTSGNAGIGTTSPAFPLEVDGGADVVSLVSTGNIGVGIVLDATVNSGHKYHLYSTTAAAGQGAGFFTITDETAPWTDRLVINPSGSVGIGTSSPIVGLDLSGKTDALALPVGTTAQRPSGGNLTSGEIRYNSSLPAVEAYVNGSWTSLGGASTVASSAGRLQCSGATCSTTGSTTIAYCPYKGNVKTTASQGNYTIPSSCLTATTTSMYVGGVGSSSVAASTTYYIYLWNTSGTWVLDAETTGHATDSSTGIEIKSGDNTKTLVGMIRTDSNKKVFTGGQTNTAGDTNTVATWDNRIPTRTQCGFTTTRTSTSSAGQVEVNAENRCLFMSWGDAASLSSTQNGFLNTSGGSINTWISLDSVGSPLVNATGLIQPNSGQAMLLVAPAAFVPSEGFHYTVLSVQLNAGTTVTYWSPQKEWVYTIQ